MHGPPDEVIDEVNVKALVRTQMLAGARPAPIADIWSLVALASNCSTGAEIAGLDPTTSRMRKIISTPPSGGASRN